MNYLNYYLVLEKRLGDYNLIDINKLDICKNYVTNDISQIDSFTCLYEENEIKDAVKRSNMVHDSYLDGNLKVISEAKHNFKALTKDIFDIVREFQNNNDEIDRELKNKLFGIYKKIVESTFTEKNFINGLLSRFKDALKNSKKRDIFKIIEELPYSKSRIIYFLIYDEYYKRIVKLNDEL